MSNRGDDVWLELLREQHLAPAIGAVIQLETIPVSDGGDGEWVRKLVDLRGVAKPPVSTNVPICRTNLQHSANK
eukprot:3002790-Heterocapsa_arctica.AAC.1